MRRKLFVWTIFTFVCINIFSQPAGRQNSAPMEASISGQVVDNSTGQPVEYAAIGLYRLKDSTLVTGIVTDISGKFVLDQLSFGRFYIDINFMGYKKSRISGITLNPNQKKASLGIVKLEPSVTVIKSVEVTAERSGTEYKIDKKVVNVSQQIAASGGTAIEVLENTPSVQSDIDGNIQLRGSSNFTVLIDGKPSILQGSEALQQIPASSIQNIEIITNPSAKYDAEGSAGIINVLMKKQKIKGFNGLLNLSAGTGNKYNGDFLLNFRNSKFNYFIGGDGNDMKFKGTGYLNQYTSNDTTPVRNYQQTNSNGDMHRSGAGLKAGVDYFINDKNTLSFSGNVSQRTFGRLTYAKNYLFDDSLSSISSEKYYLQNNNSTGEHKNYSGSLDYRLKFDNNDHQLQATVYYEAGKESHPADLWKKYTDSNWDSNPSTAAIQQKSTEDGNEMEFRGKIDYTKPVGEKGKFGAGYQARYESSNTDYHFKNWYEDHYVDDSAQLNNAKYTQNIEALYTTLSNSLKIFDYQIGLRVEYTDRDIVKKVTNEKYPVSRFDFFPSIHLSKQLPWELQAQLSYSRRINRPDDHDLDPFRTYIDSKNVRQGDPGLKPEFTDSYELNFQKKMGEKQISIEGFYRQTNDKISDVKRYVDTLIIQTYANFKRDYSLGTDISLNLPLTKSWSFNVTSSIYKYHIDGSIQDSTKSQNTVTMNARANTSLRLKWGMQIQVNYFYNAPSVTPQGTREGFSFTTIGVKQDLFKKKASLTLQVRDLFGTMKYAGISESSNLYSYNRMKREARVCMLTFTYRINNYKQQARRESEGVNETEFNGGGME